MWWIISYVTISLLFNILVGNYYVSFGIVGFMMLIVFAGYIEADTINFGPYKGEKWEDIPDYYLERVTEIRDDSNAKNALIELRKRRRKQKKSKYYKSYSNDNIDEKLKKIGDNFEKFVGQEYKKMGYKIEPRGLELGHKDGGIDIIAKKGNEILLIQCKYWKSLKVEHNHVKEFYGNCNFYIDEENKKGNYINRENVKCIYAIPDRNSLSKGAEEVFKNKSSECWYKVFPCKLIL